MNEKPTRCIDPVIKDCQDCRYGHCIYPKWVETREDLSGCCFDTVCILGYDKGRPEDEPTEDELKKFAKWCERTRQNE